MTEIRAFDGEGWRRPVAPDGRRLPGVELGLSGRGVVLRNSETADVPPVWMSRAQLSVFLAAVRDGQFDDMAAD